MTRKIVWLVVLFAAIFLLGGFVLARMELIPIFTLGVYLNYAAIVGGIASVFGLLGLALPGITSDDLRRLNLDGLRRVADLAEEMQSAEDEIHRKSAEIDELKLKKIELELLVRKASMSLHLQTRYEQNLTLMEELYRETIDIRDRLEAIGEEISDSADPTLLNEVMELVREKERSSSREDLERLLWIKPNFFGIGIDVNALVRRLTALTRK